MADGVRCHRTICRCPFNYTTAYPIWDLDNVSGCELELYDHRTNTGMNPAAIDNFDNVNLAYVANYSQIVRSLHAQIVTNWDGGVRPPVVPPSPGPGPPQPQPGLAGFLRYTDKTTGREVCVSAGPGGQCTSQPESAPLWAGPCTAKSAVWQQTSDGVELKTNRTAGQCLNLYGGARAGTCPDGTAIHLHACSWSKAKGDRFQLIGSQIRLLADSATDPCSGLCATLTADGCIVANACTVASATGWAIAAAGGSWE
jgi:hypothetical protein